MYVTNTHTHFVSLTVIRENSNYCIFTLILNSQLVWKIVHIEDAYFILPVVYLGGLGDMVLILIQLYILLINASHLPPFPQVKNH